MPKKMGRPLIEIDWKQLDKLCILMATLEDIAGWFDCSIDTIERAIKREHNITFAEYYKKKSARGRISLRRKQYEVAMSGNVSMLIWLGKQVLGQADKQDIEHSSSKINPLQIIVSNNGSKPEKTANENKTT